MFGGKRAGWERERDEGLWVGWFAAFFGMLFLN